MKHIITILIVSILCIQLHAQVKSNHHTSNVCKINYSNTVIQNNWWTKWGHATFGILYQVTTHSFNAIGDGYIHRGRYITFDQSDITKGKAFNAAFYTMMFLDYPIHTFTNKQLEFSWKGLARRGMSSLFVRVIVFDPVHNAMIGENYNYIGNVSLTDKFYQATSTGENQNNGWWPIRIVSFGCVIGINYTNQYE